MRMTGIVSVAMAGAVLPHVALAHSAETSESITMAWDFEPWIVASLAVTMLGYGLGAYRLRRKTGGRVIGPTQVGAFCTGIAVLALALLSPLDAFAAELFSAHMTQHLLLMFAAPPLLVWSRPAIAFLWAVPARRNLHVGHLWNRFGPAYGIKLAMHPVLVWMLFTGFFVFWHIPGPYQAALRHEGLHVLEHASFLTSSLAWWTIVIEPSGRRRLGYGSTLLFVTATAILGELPGALMIFATRPLYPAHADGVVRWGLTLLQDQELAGLIMWIPAGFVYLAAIAWLFAIWLREAERRVSRSMRGTAMLISILLFAVLGGCDAKYTRADESNAGGRSERGPQLIAKYGCGACHIIPGIADANGLVGPPLVSMGRRVYIAGMLPNTNDNMVAWLQNPQAFVPGNIMPNMGLTAAEALDLAAYLQELQ